MSLRSELRPFSIQVGTINPSVHRTTMLEESTASILDRRWNKLSLELREQYGEAYYLRLRQLTVETSRRIAWRMRHVGNQTVRLLNANNVPMETVVGLDGKLVALVLRMLPFWIQDLLWIIMRPIPVVCVEKRKQIKQKLTPT